jgi:hypothetical protein
MKTLTRTFKIPNTGSEFDIHINDDYTIRADNLNIETSLGCIAHPRPSSARHPHPQP